MSDDHADFDSAQRLNHDFSMPCITDWHSTLISAAMEKTIHFNGAAKTAVNGLFLQAR